MPPGTAHAVYTPVASFSRGGHLYKYDTMHYTQLSRHCDMKYGRFATNDVHHHTMEVLCRMVVTLWMRKASKLICGLLNVQCAYRTPEVHKRPLVALLFQILRPGDYDKAWNAERATTQQAKGKGKEGDVQHFEESELYRLAKTTAEDILRALGLGDAQVAADYLDEWLKLDEEIDVKHLLQTI